MSNARGIVVLGMHRSGTSCVAGLLHAMGAYFGAPEMDLGANAENPRGFWERKDFNWACEFALLVQGAIWHAPPADGAISPSAASLLSTAFAQLRGELDAHAPWFIKDPRLCILLPALLPQLDDAVFVHVVRDPIEIAMSLARRNAMSQAQALALWELHMLGAFAATYGRPRFLVDFAKLLDRPEQCVAELAAFVHARGISGIALPNAADLTKIVEPMLRRERRTSDLARYLNADQLDLQRAIENATILDEPATRTLSNGARSELEHCARARDVVRRSPSHPLTGAVAARRAELAGALLERGLHALIQPK